MAPRIYLLVQTFILYTFAYASVPASILAEESALIPTDRGNAGPTQYFSTRPAAGTSYTDAQISLIIANPTYFPSAYSVLRSIGDVPSTSSATATAPDQGYLASLSAELNGILPTDVGTLGQSAYASVHPAEYSSYVSELDSIITANPNYFPTLASELATESSGSQIPIIPQASSITPAPAPTTFHTSPRPLFSSGFVPQRTSAPVIHNPNPTPVGAIAGGVVGGVVVIALIGISAFFLRRSRKRKAAGYPKQEDQARQSTTIWQLRHLLPFTKRCLMSPKESAIHQSDRLSALRP